MSRIGQRLERFWWGRTPRALSRISPVVAAAAFDGAYLVGWRLVGAIAPLVALGLGLALGAVHPPDGGYTFTSSLLLTAVLLGVGGFGSGIGLWLVVGFAVGDFALFPHLANETIGLRCAVIDCTIVDEILKVRAPLLISYVLLAEGTVLVPFVATAVRAAGLRLAARFVTPGLPLGVGLQAVAQGALSFLWASSLAFALRPLWSFFGDQPPVGEVQPVQDAVVVLGLVGATVGGLRVALEYAAIRRAEGVRRFQELAAIAIAGAKGARLPFPIGVVLVAVLTSAVAAGLVESWLGAAVMLAALIGIGLIRARLTRVVPLAGAVVRRVPLIVRLLFGAAIAFLASRAILDMDWGRSGFTSSLVAFLVTLLAFAVVVPEQAPDDTPAATPATSSDTTAEVGGASPARAAQEPLS
jgi:hypothetical protein